MLSKNMITGIKKTKKKKHNTVKKKIVLVATVGLPVPLTPHLYRIGKFKPLPFFLTIPDETRKKMGKKKK